MKQLLACGCLIILGMAVGIVNGYWEVAGVRLPQVQDSDHVPAIVSSDAAARAKVVVTNGEMHDFGVMEQNTKKTHVFEFRNDGNLPLRLTVGSTSCKCTISELSQQVVQPNATAEVKLEWEAKTADGDFRQTAEIGTSDPDRKTIQLVVYGKVRQAIFSDRKEFVFNQATVNEEAVSRIRAYAFLSDTFEITKHEFRNPTTAQFFDVQTRQLDPAEVAEEEGARAGVEITVTLKPGMPLGAIDQTIHFEHNIASQPGLFYDVVGKIVGDITVTGPKVNSDSNTVSLGAIAKGRGTEVTIFVLIKGPRRDETTITLDSVSPASTLQAELGEVIKDNPKIVRYPLTLRVLKEADPTNMLGVGDAPTGEVVLKSTHPDVPEFRLKVRFLIKDEER